MNEPRYLLDTDTCIYIARRRPVQVARHLARYRPGEVAMSTITFGELHFGACRSVRKAESLGLLRELAGLVPVLPLPPEAAERYGEVRSALARSGTPIGNNDLWIAAHAQALAVTLVTNNVREFSRIRGLHIENWVDEGVSETSLRRYRVRKKR